MISTWGVKWGVCTTIWGNLHLSPFKEVKVYGKYTCMVWYRSCFASTVKCWEMRGVSYWIKIGTKTPYKYAKTHITQNLSGNIFVSHFLELKKGEPQSCLWFSVDCAESQIFFCVQRINTPVRIMELWGWKGANIAHWSLVFWVCLMDSKTCKNQVFWRYRL